ncbi:MAG: hypothetical protein BGO76_04875 [Caedibacter sp. 38-128]|nr:MAG: hypothetical protein BGO76_04875 [Caedibacter sp. 38-128]
MPQAPRRPSIRSLQESASIIKKIQVSSSLPLMIPNTRPSMKLTKSQSKLKSNSKKKFKNHKKY